MITKNWYTVFKAQMAQDVIYNGLRDTSGITYDAGYATGTTYLNMDTVVPRAGSLNFSRSSTGIVFGSGSTPPTLDDYTLEEMIEEGLSGSIVRTVNEDLTAVCTITLTNISDEDITIGEVGLHAWAPTKKNGTTKVVLIERTLLEEPVTIPAGGVGIVTYTLGMNIPEA